MRRLVGPDPLVFQLHYKVTTLCILVAWLFVLSQKEIDCWTPASFEKTTRFSLPPEYMTSFCLQHITICIMNSLQVVELDREEWPIRVSYYKYLSPVFVLQAVMCTLPYMIRISVDPGTFDAFIQGYKERRKSSPMAEGRFCEKAGKVLTESLMVNSSHSSTFTRTYLMCLLLSLMNAIGQVFLMASFYKVPLLFIYDCYFYTKNDDDAETTFTYYFPLMAKCTYHMFGEHGSIIKRDAMCLLHRNEIMQHFYSGMVIWFTVVSALTAVYFVAILCVMCVNSSLTLQKKLLLRYVLSGLEKDNRRTECLVKRIRFGDAFYLYLLSKNVDEYSWKMIVRKMAARTTLQGGTQPKIEEEEELLEQQA